MHTEKRHDSFSGNSLSRKKLYRLQALMNKKEREKRKCSILLNGLQDVHVYTSTHTPRYVLTPHTQCFHHWFLFLLPHAVLLIWNSGVQSVTLSSTLTINTRYHNKCNLSCSLLTFPFFNCMFSFFQLCIIDLRWRLQRKEKFVVPTTSG